MGQKKYQLLNVNSNEAYPICYGLKVAFCFEKRRLAIKYLDALRDKDNYIIGEI